jgi:flagellin
MNTEFNQLVEEIARIASVAQFNRTEILKGNSNSSVLDIQVGIHANNDNKIEINLNTLAATIVALGLATIKASGITTLTNAATSITTLDSALNAINSRRAYLGAIQNRLENAINEATNYSENLASSASQILDVDYAEESANMTRYQIMQQAGVAALGQAKAIPQSVVSLLS